VFRDSLLRWAEFVRRLQDAAEAVGLEIHWGGLRSGEVPLTVCLHRPVSRAGPDAPAFVNKIGQKCFELNAMSPSVLDARIDVGPGPMVVDAGEVHIW
jgi:hypothetical protein